MQVPFRQGIVRSVPNFLQVTGNTVSLVIPQPDYVLVTVAHGSTDYLLSEKSSVPNAWSGSFATELDYWLYWDIHPLTGAKTYGHTLYEPIEGFSAPTAPVGDQHWFDTTSNKMKVWNATAGRWVEKIRAFAAKLTGSSLFVSMSVNSPAFEGTQVGSYVNSPVLAGYLVFDDEGKALRKGNGTFFTTEDAGITGITSSSRVRLGSIVKEAEAVANMSNYTVVVFTDFDKVGPAYPSDFSRTKQFGIIEEDVVIGDFVNVITEGTVSSVTWDWSPYGVNTLLYVGPGGALSISPTAPALNPVAIITGKNSIQMGTPNVTVNTTGSTVEVMTPTVQGTGRLSVTADNPTDPIVVGTNDPRMSDPRFPLSHSHEITEVNNLSTELSGKLSLGGGVLTGTLTLNADPTNLLDAATKQYVDAHAGGGTAVYSPIVGHKYGRVADSPGSFYAYGVQQWGITTKMSVTEYVNTPLVRLNTPLALDMYASQTSAPNALGYEVFVSEATAGDPSKPPVAYAVFKEMEYTASVFVNPYSMEVQNNPAGSGIPVGLHNGSSDNNMVSVKLATSTPPAYISRFNDPLVSPSSLVGLDSGTNYVLTLELTNPSASGILWYDPYSGFDAGEGYQTPGVYTNVPLTNDDGSGTGAGAMATITIAGGVVTNVVFTTAGAGYSPGDVVSANATNLGGRTGGADFFLTVGTTTPITVPLTIAGANVTTFESLITEINNVLAASTIGAQCAWSFGNAIVFVLGNADLEQTASYLRVTDEFTPGSLYDVIGTAHNGWTSSDVPATGPQPVERTINSDEVVSDMMWNIPIVGSTPLNGYVLA